MAQVKAPREFKFVGAYSRKRRRRKVPPSKEASTTPKSPPLHTSSVKQRGQQVQITVEPDTVSEPVLATCELPPSEPAMHSGHSVLDTLLPQDPAHGASELNIDGSRVGWPDSDSGLMNLFQDLSADYNIPLDSMSMAGQFTVPSFFPGSAAGGPFNNPFGYLGGSPLTDSSARSQPQPDNHDEDDDDDDANDEDEELQDDTDGHDMSLYNDMNDITLPPPETYSLHNGISHTISQLLTRCKWHQCRGNFLSIQIIPPLIRVH
jgi:hypothetical protein